MSPEELDALLAAYALDALDERTREMVDARVAGDAAATAQLAQYEEAVALMAHEVGPPDHVWDRLAGVVFPGEPRVPHPRRLVPRGRAAVGRRRTVLAGLAAAACVAGLAVGVVLATGRGSSPSTLSSAANVAAGMPGARVTTLRRDDGTEAASVVVLPDGTGYLTSHLAALGAGRTYQLWAVGHDSLVSLGVLGPQPQVIGFTLVGAARGLAITDEPAGGVSVTHQTPTASGVLPPV
jgi:anti-sigma-K factor RskA